MRIIVSFVRSRVGTQRRPLSHNYSSLSGLNIANILNNFAGNISAVQISDHIVRMDISVNPGDNNDDSGG